MSQTLSEQLKAAVDGCDLSLRQISIGSGVDYAALHKFVHSNRDIQLTTAAKLAAYFGMRLTRPKKPKPAE